LVEYRNFPLVLKTDGTNPVGIAESSSIGTLYISSLVVSTVYADTYQNIPGSFNFTGILTVTSTGSGVPIVDNSDPNNPKFRAFSVTTDGFVTITPHPGANPGLDIQFGSNALGPERGGTGYDSPGGEGEIPAWTGGQLQPRPGFTFNSDILSLPVGGEYQVGGSQIGLNNLADINVASPDTNEVLTWNGGSWVNLPPLTGAGTTISLPSTPGRIPYTIDTTSLGSVPWFNVDTGSGRVNVCSVCAVGSVCATTFVEGGQTLLVKYQPKGNYQPCDVSLTEISTAGKVNVTRGGTGLTSLIATGILYASDSTTVAQTPAPSTNTYLKWNGTAYTWDSPAVTGTGTTIPNIPGRIPYVINATSLGEVPWFNIETGTGRVNVCSVCAVGSVCATTFVEGGQTLVSKYQPVGNYQPCDVFLTTLTTNGSVRLNTPDVTNILPLTKGGLGFTSLDENRILVGGAANSVTTITSPSPGYLKWNGTAFTWDSPTGTTTTIPNIPGRIPYIIDATSLGEVPWLNIETGTGRVNVCSVCAVGSVCATTFVEGGTTLLSKYLTQAIAATTYQTKSDFSTFTGTLNELAFVDQVFLDTTSVTGTLAVSKGGTGLTTLTAGSFLIGNGTSISLTPTSTFETTGYSRANFATIASLNNYVLTSTYSTFTGTLGDLAFIDQVNLTTTSVTGTLPILNGGTGKTTFVANQLIYGTNFTQDASLTFDGTVLKSPTVCGTTVCATTVNEGGQALSVKYLLNSDFTTFTGTTLKQLAYKDRVDLGTTSVTGTLTVNRGGTGLTSLTPTGILYALNTTTVTQTPAPSTNTYLKWNGTAFAWDTPGTSLPTTPDADKFLSSVVENKDPYTNGGVYLWLGGAENATLLGPPDSASNYILKCFAGGILKWEQTSDYQFGISPPELTSPSANYFSAIVVDQLSSTDHYNENSYIFYAEATTLNAGTISATTYLNLPTSAPAFGSSTELQFRGSTGALSSSPNLYWSSTTSSIVTPNLYIASTIQFNTGITPTLAVGQMSWNSTDQTLDIQTTADTTLQIGQEQVMLVENKSGAAIQNGKVVYVSGTTGGSGKLNVALAAASSTNSETAFIIGVATQTINNNSTGFVTTFGKVNGIPLPTSAFSDGDIAYLGDTPGELRNYKPRKPSHGSFQMGRVVRAHNTNGILFVTIRGSVDMSEIHDVASSIPGTGQVLVWNNASGLYEPKNVSAISGINNYATTGSLQDHIASAVHWDLTTLNNNYINASGDSVTGAFFFKNLSATTFSATTYLNLPTSALSGLSDTQITSPALSSVLKWNGTKWVAAPDQTGGGGGGTPAGAQYDIQVNDGAAGFYADGSFQYDYDAAKVIISTNTLQVDSVATFNNSTDFTQPVTFTTIRGTSVSSTTVSATTYLNLPSGVATWNANKLQSINVSSTTPNLNDVLSYNGGGWVPQSVVGKAYVLGNNLIL
jgi:hypothetical protein